MSVLNKNQVANMRTRDVEGVLGMSVDDGSWLRVRGDWTVRKVQQQVKDGVFAEEERKRVREKLLDL